jgi:hypothetical protein
VFDPKMTFDRCEIRCGDVRLANDFPRVAFIHNAFPHLPKKGMTVPYNIYHQFSNGFIALIANDGKALSFHEATCLTLLHKTAAHRNDYIGLSHLMPD